MLMEADFTAESENFYQNISLYEVYLLDWLKEEFPKSPHIAKITNFANGKILKNPK